MSSAREIARAICERELTPEEFDRRCAAALAEEDTLADARELVRWFRRRYPTALERLRYARRQHAAWTST